MKRKILPALVLGLVLLSAAAPSAVGDTYVGGPWGTRINRLPCTITAPGAYYLGGNLTYAGTDDGITVTAGINHVTLDLMGFTLNGAGSGRYGIYLNGSKNVEIRNGTVTGWGTGIREDNSIGKLHRIINVRAVGNNNGIWLLGGGHLVQTCQATATGSNKAIKIDQGMVSGCNAKLENGYGIEVQTAIVRDNVVTGTGAISPRYGIPAGGRGNLIMGNKVKGCTFGIGCGLVGQNIIGNTVDAADGAVGVYLLDFNYNLLDQNTITGTGNHYNVDYNNVQERNNY